MKSIELFCASPASTAICSSMEQHSMVRRGTRQIDHHHHHTRRLGDPQKGRPHIPCTSSQLPFDPNKLYNYQKGRKSSAKQDEIRRKSSADVADLASPRLGSSRYLLNDNPAFDMLTDGDNDSALVPYKPVKDRLESRKDFPVFRSLSARTHESPLYKLPSTKSNHAQVHKSSSHRTRSSDQVVELRVSIHCKGCEGKVRKHLAKMEGVTSFSIDLASKKVIVTGDVTPLGVLASISKVKNAQFWPSPTSSSSSSSSMSGRS